MSVAQVHLADEVDVTFRPFRPTEIDTTLPLGPQMNEQWFISQKPWAGPPPVVILWAFNPPAFVTLPIIEPTTTPGAPMTTTTRVIVAYVGQDSVEFTVDADHAETEGGLIALSKDDTNVALLHLPNIIGVIIDDDPSADDDVRRVAGYVNDVHVRAGSGEPGPALSPETAAAARRILDPDAS